MSLETALHALNDAAKVSEGIANLQFHSKRHVCYSSRIANAKDIKWIEDKRSS